VPAVSVYKFSFPEEINDLTEVQPFRGVVYDVPDGDLAKVLAPPYDVIPPAYQAELYARDPRNVVRVVLNREPGDAGYEDAGRTYRRWLDERVLTQHTEPALYLVEQTFAGEDGRTLRRFGLLARFRAEDPEKGVILPHEHTRKAAKEDRFRVLKATRANFSPIFLMFPDPEARFAVLASDAMVLRPRSVYTDDGGVAHRVWRVTNPELIASFQQLLASPKAYIADGHHRHATALRYRDEVGADGAWTFGYFTPMGAPGLLVLPYHRILAEGPSLAEARGRLEALPFQVADASSVAEAAQATARSRAPYAFALAAPGQGALVVEARPEAAALLPLQDPPSLRALDTYFFHKAVMPRALSIPEEAVSYVHSLAEAEEAVSGGRCRIAALMRGTPVGQIVDVAEAKESMPAKSTFFHPKLPSGLVIHPLVV
jgi:uncharacterized protein (DUF1015 family)